MKMNVCNEQTNQQTDFANQWITKQAAIDALGDMVMNWTDSDYELGQLNQWKADRKAIIDLPSAQPKRKTGKWIRTDMTDIVDGKYINWAKWNCSECGVVKKIGWAKGVNFCPNCGADMRGEQDD